MKSLFKFIQYVSIFLLLGLFSSASVQTIVKHADGTETTVKQGPDIRYGMLASIPTRTEIKLPSGKKSTTTVKQEAQYADFTDPLSIQRQTYTVTENSRTSTSVFDFGTLTYTNTSPEGRQSFSTIDLQGRITSSRIPGIEPVYYSYDSRGRLQSVTQGTGANQRSSVTNYGTDGFVSNTQDALNRSVQFDNDLSGRILSQSLPGNRLISFDYDATGNVTGITPPQKPEHTFSYTPVNLTANYEPPSVAGIGNTATTYLYNLDKQLTLATRPDGQTVSYNYGQTSGRLESITTTTGQYAYGYDSAGRINLITAPGNETLSFRYDGPLQLEEKWQGVINGQINWVYDNNLWPSIQSVSNSQSNEDVFYYYDRDGLLTAAGDLSLSHDAQNGLLTGTALGNVTDSHIYNSFGETTEYTAEVSGNPVFGVEYTRDKLGRITDKTETVDTITTAYRYEYDEAGRLTEIAQNGITISRYEYDENGNRTAAQIGVMNYAGTYDDQDRLLAYGATAYTYTPNGELQTKTNIIGTTNYAYDVFGNLRSATLPGGTEIEYVIDGQDRRIGKKVNGTLEQGFLYDGQIQIVAELDGEGNIVSRFIYGDRLNVPSYMQKGGETYRIIADHLGSPRLIINATDGSIIQRMDYDEYGNVLTDTNPGFQPFGFAGGLYDRDTGLTRFGARDYDPHTGRWTAKDPIDFDGEDTNLYGYVGNDPINTLDPIGLILWYADSASEQTMRPHILEIMKTPVGRRLLKQLHDSPQIYYIHGKAGPRGPVYRLGNDVYVDPTLIYIMDTDCDHKPASTTRLLAHELGHLTGTRDDGPGQMNNVNKWENPIMYPIEKYNRTKY